MTKKNYSIMEQGITLNQHQVCFFLMITGEPLKNFERQRKLNNTKHADILKDFSKYFTEFKHISIMSANAEIYHVSVFLDSLSHFPDDWSMLTANDVSNYICTSFHGLKNSSNNI
ncbi:MAG: hypothetical protein ACERKN_03935 [Velocimicrobium sp.]